jgi:hypothetical protein
VNASYRSVQNVVLSASLCKENKINYKKNVHRILNFPLSCGCETWSLIFKEEDKLRTFEIKVLRKLFEPKEDLATGYGGGGNSTMRGFVMHVYCSSHINMMHVYCSSHINVMHVYCSSHINVMHVYRSSHINVMHVYRSSHSNVMHVYCSSHIDQIKNNEMSGVCSTCGEE